VIHITADAVIEIGAITGGFGITATIRNIGIVDAVKVNWSISLQGPVFFGKEKTGTLLQIVPAGERTVATGFFLGLGTTKITVKAMDTEKTATAFLLGPFALNVR
jgi:hypothetical protein